MSPKRERRLYTRKEKRDILRQVQDSGLTVPVWCEKNAFNSATLYQWFRDAGMQAPRSGYGKYARANGGRAVAPGDAPKLMPARSPRETIRKTLMERAAPPPPKAPPPKPAPGLTVRLGDTELSFGEAPSPEYLAQLA